MQIYRCMFAKTIVVNCYAICCNLMKMQTELLMLVILLFDTLQISRSPLDYPKLKQVFICKTLMGHRFESMDAVTYNILLNKTKKKVEVSGLLFFLMNIEHTAESNGRCKLSMEIPWQKKIQITPS